MGARIRDAQVVFDVHECASRRVKLVLGIQQVEQRALADVELLAVGVTRAVDRLHIAFESALLFGQAADVEKRDAGGLACIAAGLVTQVGGLVEQVRVLAHPSLIGATVEQVPVQHDGAGDFALLVFDTVEVAAATAAHTCLDPRLIATALDLFTLRAHGAVVLDRGCDGRTACRRAAHRGGRIGRQAGVQQDRCAGVGIGRIADQAAVALRHIVQVGPLSGEVGIGQCQPCAGLFEIDTTRHAGTRSRLDLGLDVLVLHVVVFGQLDQATEAHDVVVGAGGFERGLLAHIDELEVARQPGVAEAVDFPVGGQAVPQHLGDVERDTIAAQALVLGGVAAGDGIAGLADFRIQVHPRVVRAGGDTGLVLRGLVGIEARGDLGVRGDRLQHRRLDGADVLRHRGGTGARDHADGE